MTSPRPDQLPPHDMEAEEAVLASVLVDQEAWANVSGIVRAEDFFKTKNGWIFAACTDLVADGVSLNQVTVGHALARREQLEEIGGIAYLSKLVTDLPTPVGCEYYAQIVRRDALYRSAINRAQSVISGAYRANGNLPELIDTWKRNGEELTAEAGALLGSAGRFDVLEGTTFAELVGDAPHVIEGIAPRPGFTVIAGMGESFKSWITEDMAVSVAAGFNVLGRFVTEQGPAVIFDQEVDKGEVTRRLQKLTAGRKLDLTTLPIAAIVDEGLDLDNASDLAAVIDAIKQRGAILAVFDSVGDFFPGINLKADEEVRPAIAKFKQIGRETGAAIIGVHHLRKSNKDGVNTTEERLFGSVYWRNDADSYFAFQLHGEDRVLVAPGKSRRGKRPDPFLIVCDGDTDDDFVRFGFGGQADESLDKQSQAEGWVLRTLAERGPTKRPELLAAAASAKIASARTVTNALAGLVGSGLVEKSTRSGQTRGAVYYWLEGAAPDWAKTEEMI